MGPSWSLELVVEVREERAARSADRADPLAGGDLVADLHRHAVLLEVREHADLAAAVLDQHGGCRT